MAAIPQIVRDRLASSVVGTPGVDTSAAQNFASIGKVADTAGQVSGEYAIAQQQNRDVAEQNRLFIDYKMKAINSMEQLKTQYADNPEAAGPVYEQALKTHLADTVKQATNPRVALMVGRGDSYYDGIMLRQQQLWAYDQRERLDKTAVVNQGNDLIAKAGEISGSTQSYKETMDGLLPLASAAGNLTAGAFAVAHPDSANELKQKMLPSLYTSAIFKKMETNPAQAVAMTEDANVQKAFAANPKELDQLRERAMQRVEGLGKELEWHQALQPLIDHPQMYQDVVSGKTDWNAITKMPEGKAKESFLKLALDLSPQNVQERNDAVMKFAEQARAIGAQYKQIPAGRSVSDLVKFQDDVTEAVADKLISRASGDMLLKKLAVPLRDAVLKAHDPDTLGRLKKTGGFLGMFQKTEPADQTVDKYVGAYDTMNKWTQYTGKSNDWQFKADILRRYYNFHDNTKAEDRDAQGRPYTAVSLMQKAMGIAVGDSIQTKFGLKTITGHTSDGIPKFDVSDEEMAKLNNLRSK